MTNVGTEQNIDYNIYSIISVCEDKASICINLCLLRFEVIFEFAYSFCLCFILLIIVGLFCFQIWMCTHARTHKRMWPEVVIEVLMMLKMLL